MDLRTSSFQLLASTCILCSAPTYRAQDICQGCLHDLPWNRSPCMVCGQPVNQPATMCTSCLQHSPGYSACITPLLYRFPIDKLVQRFKGHGDLAAGHVLGEILSDAVAHATRHFDLCPTIVPVPLHFTRRLTRGFNQSLELANILADKLTAPCSDVLLRNTRGKDQKTQSGAERSRNLRDHFKAVGPVSGQVILVDDVITSGATVAECTRVLLKAGAEDVIVTAPARTPAVC